MLILNLTLSRIYFVLVEYEYDWIEYLAIRVGFSLYFGWIIAATFLNIYAGSTNTQDQKYVLTSVIGLVVVSCVEFGVAVYGRDGLISAVGTWALVAIAQRWTGKQNEIVITAYSCAGVLGLVTLALTLWSSFKLFQTKKAQSPPSEESLNP